jgi:hypothetical protein
VVSDLLADVRLGAAPACFAPHNELELCGERLPERHRGGLAISAVAPHIRIMPDLDDSDKAIVAKLLRETIKSVAKENSLSLRYSPSTWTESNAWCPRLTAATILSGSRSTRRVWGHLLVSLRKRLMAGKVPVYVTSTSI